MKNLFFFLSLALVGFLASCEKDDPTSSLVTQFVYDGLSTYYYWNEEVIAKKPAAGNTDPVAYFESVLNSTDAKKGWSWITDDVDDLLAGFEGESLSFGYDLAFIPDKGLNKVFALVRYVFPGSPVAKAGMKRLDLIGEINGKPIGTEVRNGTTYIDNESVGLLYGNSAVKFTTYAISDRQTPKGEVTATPNSDPKDPVLFKDIHIINGKKIGYLFYTNFYDNFNSSLFEVFKEFKGQGVSDLVLDLRYNTGGSVSAAIYLASLIAPETYVNTRKSPYITMDFNSLLNNSFDASYNSAKEADKYKYDRKDYLGAYNSKYPDPLGANLNLTTVYIIATGDSYSASELTIHCLAPYMNVVHIGENTGGKYAASWTIHGYDDDKGVPVYTASKLSTSQKNELKNWAMQPIVALYSDGNSKNFNDPGYLAPNHKLTEGHGSFDLWTEIGDTKDVLLGQALYLISGDSSYDPNNTEALLKSAQTTLSTEKKIVNPKNIGKPVVLDNVKLTPEDFRKLREP